MTATSLKTFRATDLQEHPWQKNIPDIEGSDWTAFLADIRERGVKEPIRVSLRTGQPVVVDGHQRLRAAREVGYESLEALTESFADELEEITFLAGAARFRRHLTDPQRYAIAKAYRELFKPQAEEAKREAGKRHGKGQKVSANLHKPNASVDTSAQAAELVGMSRRQFHKADAVAESNLEPVKEAWHKSEISTHAAHELTRAPDPVQDAINAKSISVNDGILLAKDKVLTKEVVKGRKTPQEAASVARQIKEANEQRRAELDYELTTQIVNTLEKITGYELADFRRAANSGESARYNINPVISGIDEALEHLQNAAQAVRIVENNDPRTLTI